MAFVLYLFFKHRVPTEWKVQQHFLHVKYGLPHFEHMIISPLSWTSCPAKPRGADTLLLLFGRKKASGPTKTAKKYKKALTHTSIHWNRNQFRFHLKLNLRPRACGTNSFQSEEASEKKPYFLPLRLSSSKFKISSKWPKKPSLSAIRIL